MKSFAERYAKYIVIFAIFLGSTSGTLGKLITADSMAIGFFRLSFSLPFFLIPVLLRKREELKAVSTKDLLWSVGSGVFLFCHFFCWFTAVKNTTVASAIILADLHPLVVMGITVIVLKKKVPLQAAIGVIVSLLGGAIVIGFDYSFSGNHLVGDIFALGAAFAMGIYFSIGGVLRKRISGDIYIMLLFFSCWCCFAIGMVATSTPIVGYPLSDYLWLIVMTALCQLGAHAVFNWSMGFVSSLYLSAWGISEIVAAALLAMLILGEVPSLSKIIGGMVVITGLLYYNFHENDGASANQNHILPTHKKV